MSVFKEKIKIIWNVIKAKQYFFASLPFSDIDENVSTSKICCIVSDNTLLNFVASFPAFEKL